MSIKESKMFVWLLAVACAACCAIPVYLLVAGAMSGAVLLSPVLRELLICLVPLLLLGLGFYLMNRKRKSCCEQPAKSCKDNQCSLEQK